LQEQFFFEKPIETFIKNITFWRNLEENLSKLANKNPRPLIVSFGPSVVCFT
jgi:hypothetical protein